MNLTLCGVYMEFSCTFEKKFLWLALPGEPRTDPLTIDAFIPKPLSWWRSGFLNLKPKVVLNPISILYFKECQSAPDFLLLLVEMILKAEFLFWSILTSPMYISPLRVEKLLKLNEKDLSFSLNFFRLESSSRLNLIMVCCRGPMFKSYSAVLYGGKLMMDLASSKNV